MIDWNAHACSPHSGSGEMRGAAQAQTETQSRSRGHFVRQKCFSLGILSHTHRASTSGDTEALLRVVAHPCRGSLGSAQGAAASLPLVTKLFFFFILFCSESLTSKIYLP